MEARESEDSRHAKWARSAAAYSDLALQLTTYQLSNQVLADKARLAPGLEVLDLACGAGATTLAAFQVQPDLRHVWAVDPVPEMLEQARRLLQDRPVTFVPASAEGFSPALAGKRVDRVLCNAAFFHFRDHGKVLAEIGNVLRRDGLLGLTLPGPASGPELPSLVKKVVDLVAAKPAAPRQGRSKRFRPRPLAVCNYRTIGKFLTRGGFERVSSEFFTFQQSPEEIARWLTLPIFRPPELADFRRDEVMDAVLRVWEDLSPVPMTSWNLVLARPSRGSA